MKLVYPACFYSNEEGGYTVTVPDLTGCVKADEYDNGFVSLIVLDMDSYTEKYGRKAVRKN